jgi:hypothetical protein
MSEFKYFAECCKYKKNKLWKLYQTGEDKLEKEFDIVKILKSLRNMKIYFKTKINPIDKVQIYNSHKNSIELDSPIDDDNSIESDCDCENVN